MIFEVDLEGALQIIADERSQLVQNAAPLSGDALGVSQPGGWSAGHADSRGRK